MSPELSIIIPALNEQQNLSPLVVRLERLLEVWQWDAEILLVDDCSDDNTFREALRLEQASPRVRAIHKGLPRGIGHAIRTGINQARGWWGVVVMADSVDPLELLPTMRSEIVENGCQLVLVSRYQRAEDAATIPWLYRFYQAGYRWCCWHGLGITLRDTTYAFRAFKVDFIRSLRLRSGGFEISPEMTIKAWQARACIGQVAGRQGRRIAGESKFLFSRTGWGYVRVLVSAIGRRCLSVVGRYAQELRNAVVPLAGGSESPRRRVVLSGTRSPSALPSSPEVAATPRTIAHDASGPSTG